MTEKKLNWQELESKISEGLGLEESCRLVGIPLDAAQEYLKAKQACREYDTDLDQICSQSSLQNALGVLNKLLESESDGIKLGAARELLKHALTEKQRLDKKLSEIADRKPSDVMRPLHDWWNQKKDPK